MSPEMLWRCARSWFETDDGSLPTIELQRLTAVEVADLYSEIRRRSRVVSRDATFWDVQASAERPLDDVPNAARLVGAGQAAPFHLAVEGIAVEGVVIPCLGAHVFRDAIAIDYRMGTQWGGEQVFAFFSFLEQMVSRTSGALVAPLATSSADPDAFTAAWRLFRDRSPR